VVAREKTIHQDAVAPYKLKLDISSSDADFDLSTVTTIAIDVKKPPNTAGVQAEVSWVGTIAGPSPRTAALLEVEYTFIAGDLALAGEHIVEARLTTPTGVFATEPRSFMVREKFT
jgi:hypothetical protein